jgi:hypothetical protein
VKNEGKSGNDKYDESLFIVDDSDFLDLKVEKSSIKGAGQGLFAKRDFEKNEIIAEYRGKIISSDNCYHKNFIFEDKMVWVNDKYSIIGTSIASFANDCVVFELEKYNTPIY